MKSAVLNFVFFVMLKNKIEQSAAQSCLGKKLSLSEIPTDRTFENRPMKKVRPCTFFISEFYLRKTLEVITTAIRGGEAYRVYVELILHSDAADSVYIFKRGYQLNLPLTHIELILFNCAKSPLPS